MERFFALERGVHKNVSKILATINFSSGEIDGKFLSVWKNFIGNINLSQTSRLNLDKFGIRKDIHDCRSAPFALTIGQLTWAKIWLVVQIIFLLNVGHNLLKMILPATDGKTFSRVCFNIMLLFFLVFNLKSYYF